MKIGLGTFLSATDATFIAAIEPIAPAWRANLSQIADSGLLVVTFTDGDTMRRDLRLDSTSESRWALASIGKDNAAILKKEHEKYGAKPFYAVHDHSRLGRLYLTCETHADDDNRQDTHFILSTRPDCGRQPETLTLPSAKELQAFITADYLNSGLGLMPTADEIISAMNKGQRATAYIEAQKEHFLELVDWQTFNMALQHQISNSEIDDLYDYASKNEAAVRPPASGFETDSSEFYRWYEYGGFARPEPLTSAQSDSRFAFSPEDWDDFKSVKLGEMRGPVEAISILLKYHSTNDPHWDLCRKEADWCSTPNRPDAKNLLEAVEVALTGVPHGSIAHALTKAVCDQIWAASHRMDAGHEHEKHQPTECSLSPN